MIKTFNEELLDAFVTSEGDFQSSEVDDIEILYQKVVKDQKEKHSHIFYDAEVSKQIMRHLGYYESDIELVKENVPLFEGVANPFHFVKIKKGGCVLHLGCGVGVDAMISKYYAGDTGYVIGVDSNLDQINLANKVAKKHDIDVKFRIGDVEAPINGFNQFIFDYIISNGAFCLSKGKAQIFENAFKYLRSGGKLVVCTTVLKNKLPPGTTDPPGIDKIFYIDEIKPILESIGYTNVIIDMSASQMRFPICDKDECQEV